MSDYQFDYFTLRKETSPKFAKYVVDNVGDREIEKYYIFIDKCEKILPLGDNPKVRIMFKYKGNNIFDIFNYFDEISFKQVTIDWVDVSMINAMYDFDMSRFGACGSE